MIATRVRRSGESFVTVTNRRTEDRIAAETRTAHVSLVNSFEALQSILAARTRTAGKKPPRRRILELADG